MHHYTGMSEDEVDRLDPDAMEYYKNLIQGFYDKEGNQIRKMEGLIKWWL